MTLALPVLSRRRRTLAVAIVTLLTVALSAVAPAGSHAAAPKVAAPQAHTVGWDRYSMIIDGKRTFLWSGEVHPFRLPSPSLWRDVLQKMKANGYDAVTFYFDWGYHSPKPGVYDFTGVRDLDLLLDMADEAGLYVIARPGPYINAETDAGGFPAWLSATPGTARTSNATYLSYTDQWQGAVDSILARHQLTDGRGSVVLYQIENEYANNVNSATGKDYMAHLYAKARADGITVPIFHNDKGRNGFWTPGGFPLPANDTNYLYGFDGYPGGMCSSTGSPGTPGAPPDWGYFGVGGTTGGATASPNTPGLWAEAGAGWFDNWGGVGYGCLNTRMGPTYERSTGLTAIANGIKIQSKYMTFGGTSWGWLPADVVYSSYDYGAAFNEARQATPKVAAMKEMGYFVQSVAPINQIDRADPATPTGVTPAGAVVRGYHVSSPSDGTQFYVLRNDSTADEHFTLPISTVDGSFTIPQQGTVELNGRDAKILTAGYAMDSQHLVYSTSEIMTHATVDGQDMAIFDGRSGQDAETVLKFATQPTVTVLSGTAQSTWDDATGFLRLNYTQSGLTEVLVSGGGTNPLVLIFGDDAAAASFWRLDTPAGPVIARGPALLRTASVGAGRVDLTGDTLASSPLEVWAPGAAAVTWNGAPVATATTDSGSLLAGEPLAGPPAVDLPELTNWVYQYETPQAQPGFDDSGWRDATLSTSNSSTPIPAGQPDLFADDYGFHHGDIWYRGSYTAPEATAVNVSYRAGGLGMIEAWLDGQYLGTNQLATPAVYSTAPAEAATATFAIPEPMRTGGGHTLAVVVRTMGHSEDGNSNNASKAARGLTAVTLTGASGSASAPIAWKIQGNQGGEDLVDTVRGPLNNGGLYGENAGWYLPGYPDSGWAPVSLPHSDPNPGIAWYRTTFTLTEPSGVDASLGLTIADTATKAYRANIFVNGWNLGQYVNNVGPQHTFVLPNGILHTGTGDGGRNTVAIAVITNSPGGGTAGGGLGTVSLTNLGTAAGGVPVSDVDSPAYEAPSATGSLVLARVGQAWTGTVGHVRVPADAAGAQLAATVDWGDGTSSAGSLPPGGDITGTHTYAASGSYPVTVHLTDRYSGDALATATGTAIGYDFAPGGGTFAVGDATATGAVEFWADTWANDNQLSGGSAPDAFKGFAANPATPACGSPWTTRPGGSSAPPAGPLPEYLAAAATGKVTQHGSAIAGDTAHLVIVRTDPGYGPDPTQHGTGTVVAILC
jgi:beta-galactosidase GanA